MQAFTLAGRVSRLGYWRRWLLINVLIGVVWILGNLAIIGLGPFGALIFIGFVPLLAAGFAVSVRRLHDRNRGGVWLLVFYVGPWLLAGIAQSAIQTAHTGLILLALAATLVGVALTLWGLVDISFLRGSPEPNRFGEAPAVGR